MICKPFVVTNHSSDELMEYGHRKMMFIIKAFSELTMEYHLILMKAPSKEIAEERFSTNINWSRYNFYIIDTYCTEFEEDMSRFLLDNDTKKAMIDKKIVRSDNGLFVMKNAHIPCDFSFRNKCTTIYHIYPRKVWVSNKLYRKKNKKSFFDRIDRLVHASIKTTRTRRNTICSSTGKLPVDSSAIILTDISYVLYGRKLEHIISLIKNFYTQYGKIIIQRNVNFFYCDDAGVLYSLTINPDNILQMIIKETDPIFV